MNLEEVDCEMDGARSGLCPVWARYYQCRTRGFPLSGCYLLYCWVQCILPLLLTIDCLVVSGEMAQVQ
jgi:hypothetical protein